MKIVMEKVTPDKLARYLQNNSLRVFGVTPISEGYKPDREDEMNTHYNVEMLVLGELRDTFFKLLEGEPTG
jgi:hypothetical protein